MTIEVLGLGESLSNYKPSDNITIGVNDIFSFHPVDYLVVLDPPKAFSKERREVIKNSTPKVLYSYHDTWECKSELIKIAPSKAGTDYSWVDEFDFWPKTTNSTFTATVLAYRLGATKIILHGADFNTHRKLSKGTNLGVTLIMFEWLYKALKKLGVELFVSSEKSKLATYIPVIKL